MLPGRFSDSMQCVLPPREGGLSVLWVDISAQVEVDEL